MPNEKLYSVMLDCQIEEFSRTLMGLFRNPSRILLGPFKDPSDPTRTLVAFMKGLFRFRGAVSEAKQAKYTKSDWLVPQEG